MKFSRIALLLVTLTFAAGGVSYGVVTVATATTDLKSIAESVGGDHVKVISICKGNQDPHFIQAKPSYMVALRNADLWIRIGMELEIGWEGPIIEGSRNPKIQPGQPGFLDASEGILRLEVPTGKITREMGDVHPMGNPHYWLDPLNGRIIAGAVADRLCQIDPQDADAYKTNLNAFQKALDERMFGADLVAQVGGDKLWAMERGGTLVGYLKDANLIGKLGGWAGKMLPLQGDEIITFHRSWSYFVNRFGLTVADELEGKPGIPPSPGHVLEVIDKVNSMKIKLVLVEPFYDRKPADLVAEKTEAKVLIIANSVGGEPAAKDYLSMIENVVDRVSAAFEAGSGQGGR